ncbi:MAG: hypothetical protein N2Z22_11085, partial [Turneriella sp.]|nr:hypothetical protein [Turneriella sp.]
SASTSEPRLRSFFANPLHFVLESEFRLYPKQLDERDSLERAAWFGCYIIPKNPAKFSDDSITWALKHTPGDLPEPITPENGWIFFYYRDHQTPESFGAFICDLYEFHILPPEVATAHYFHRVLSSLSFTPSGT